MNCFEKIAEMQRHTPLDTWSISYDAEENQWVCYLSYGQFRAFGDTAEEAIESAHHHIFPSRRDG